MKRKYVPFYVATFVAMAICVLGAKGYEAPAYPVEAAAVAKATTQYQRIPMGAKDMMALVEYGKAMKLAAPAQVSGRLEAYYSESKKFEEGDQPLRFALVSGKTRYEVKNLRGHLPVSADGADVTLTGIVGASRAGIKELTTNIGSTEARLIRGRLQHADGTAPRERSLGCSTTFCTLVIPVDMSGDPSVLPSPSAIHDYIFNGRPKAALLEESYGQTVIDGVVTDWVSAPSQTLYVFQAPAEVDAYLLEQGINPGAFEQVVFLVNGGSQRNGGEASVGPTYFVSNGVTYYVPVALVGFEQYGNTADPTVANGNLAYFDYLYVHETGHNLNALHDRLANCKAGPLSKPSECMSVEYGNKYSLMGDGALGGHFSVLQKLRIGWIDLADSAAPNHGVFALAPIEASSVTFGGIDGDANAVPEFVAEYRDGTGIDLPNLFTDVDLAGLFTYRMPRGQDITADPATWNGELVDMTPGTNSATWYNSMNSVVWKAPQGYDDGQVNKRFEKTTGMAAHRFHVGMPTAVSAACLKSPVKVYEPELTTGDTFTSQLSRQKWPPAPQTVNPPQNLIQDVHADVNDPGAQVFLYKKFVVFNDDFAACGGTQFSYELISDGVSLPLITESASNLPAWSGPNYSMAMAFLPVSGMSYGQHTVVLRVTKQNDGSVFERNLIFNLVP